MRGTENNIAQVVERFPNDVKDHALTVVQDEGIYRHLRFAKPGTYCNSFSIITWPGRLCFCGDMGTYVFARIEDMFEFFRHDAPNYGYWAEKCEAQDRNGGIRAYDSDRFIARARELLEERLDEIDASERDAAREAFEEGVIRLAEDERDARVALAEFDEHGVSFSDTWELNFEEYSYRFAWCCNALVWAVKKYDEYRAVAPARSTSCPKCSGPGPLLTSGLCLHCNAHASFGVDTRPAAQATEGTVRT